MSCLDDITNAMGMNLGETPKRNGERQEGLVCHTWSMGSRRVRHDLATEQQQQHIFIRG